ncbi:MAG: flagellar hook-associated protein FlgK, partial [Chloroflexi bacterium]|nr:flagellar hook-associated protein FlgK [Chloroflexota bacterium]
MRSEFGGLSIALRALLAQQQALETTGHNIANTNTEGYSRQVVRMRASNAITLPGVEGQLGTGVEVATVERLRSAFFDNQIRTQSHGLGRYETTEEFLQQIELAFNEPSESGISGALGRFFNAWREVSSQPEAISARRALVARAEEVATLLNTAARNLNALQQDADRRVQLRVDDINSLAQQIALLNDRIARVQATGDRPNDLRDERDRLLTRLSRIVDFISSEDSEGRVTVTIGGRNLVQGIDAFRMATSINASSLRDVVWYADNVAATLTGGQLYGLLLARDGNVATRLSDLNSLASTLVSQVNTLHAAGFGLPTSVLPTGSTGDNFFNPTGTTAATITVSATITGDPNRVAASTAASSAG